MYYREDFARGTTNESNLLRTALEKVKLLLITLNSCAFHF